MKKLSFFIFLILLGVANLRADDQMRTVQEQLKNQGFYYGQVDGQPGTETTAAIRRYQIRNGLQVTGTLTQETLDSLNAAGGNNTAPAPQNTAPPPPQPAPLDTPQSQPPPTDQSITQSDRDFLNKQNHTTNPTPPPPPPVDNSTVTPASPPPPPEEPPPPQAPALAQQYAVLYARTPYARAPLPLQQGTLKNAQYVLARQQFYNGAIDGIPGPGTERAITLFQSAAGIAQTGRLDLDTLGALHLLPNSGPAVAPRVIIQPFYPPPRYEPPRVYRGIWVN